METKFTLPSQHPSQHFKLLCFAPKQNRVGLIQQLHPFAGKYSDLEPAFSVDGNTLYFASNRPLSGNAIKDFDIWKVTRTNNKWGEPENLGATINTASDEFYPSVAKNGNLYFTATYAGGPGREDIYMSKLHQNQYQKPIALDSGVNTKFYEFNPFVSPEEDYIIFTSYGRKDDIGGGDLYISLKDEHGNWKPAKHLSQINSKQLDYCPFVSADGKSLFFTSERHQLPTSFPTNTNYQTIFESKDKPLNGTGNIYWVNFQSLLSSLK
jgi:Tol biopolymer transport system component